LLFGPLPTLIAYSWLLLPIGALAGATLPALARHRTALETLVIASLTAIVVALLWTIGYYLSMTLSAPSESGDLAVGIAPWLAIYCLPWTITFAFRRRSRDRSAPSPEG
jgi:hypothetical protein